MKYLLFLTMLSCTRQIAHKPTHREIKKAMRYSTSLYAQPSIKTH